MIKKSLREFADDVIDRRSISIVDVRMLNQDVMPDGIASREEADVLIALDRRIGEQCEEWGDALVALLVDFVVWGARPTGVVRSEDAHWLATSLGAGGGPTKTALRAAFEIVREAQQVDEALLAFVMNGLRSGTWRSVVPFEPRRRAA
ncbi:hypothetical protein QNA08_03250 [Chelatococcus sp. SYSU_G07232]|uniref:Uncharacterized protein n=1 Tax=Chelatococcus albus TaxID=3047466 RepID=A0ABT7ADV1_9HYPH|nr:hypothetical protein [Chelatococcus sp. SYSU_G07232]MDJ1157255.1 hypothetical protein [Chelatococcus sp. SYSU_G07232]